MQQEEQTCREITPAVLRLKEVCKFVGLSTSSIYALMAKGDFPRPVKLFGENSAANSPVAWRVNDLLAWVRTRPRVRL